MYANLQFSMFRYWLDGNNLYVDPKEAENEENRNEVEGTYVCNATNGNSYDVAFANLTLPVTIPPTFPPPTGVPKTASILDLWWIFVIIVVVLIIIIIIVLIYYYCCYNKEVEYPGEPPRSTHQCCHSTLVKYCLYFFS